ncbi:MAG: hypothetical protein PHR92_03225 [Lachnospiraceae bacterium]|nr:hypothetical protein [Lachnospiraceae bacterium]
MNKKDKITMVVYIMVGISMMIIGIIIDVDYYSSLIFAMGAGLSLNSIMQFVRYYHNTKPENIESYKEKLRKQNIDLMDERKILLRNKSGYITWAITMVCCFVASFIAALLKSENIVIIILFVIGVAEYVAALIVYKY